MTADAHQGEFQTLLDVLAARTARPEAFSESIWDLSVRSGVLDVLASVPDAPALPGPVKEELFQQAALGALRLRDLKEIAEALASEGIPVVPLKGMAYALLFEQGGPLKAMADIDLLVQARHFDSAIAALRRLGYQEGFPSDASRAADYHERALMRDGRLVEIHRSFLSGGRVRVDYDALWSRTRTFASECEPCLRLSPEDTLVYHCFHMGIHEFAVGGLRSLWDLRQLLLQDAPDLVLAAGRARRWGTRRITWCALRLLDECFPGAIAPGDLTRFAPARSTRLVLEAAVVRPALAQIARPGFLPRPVQLFRKALLLDRPLAGVGYLGRYARIRFLG